MRLFHGRLTGTAAATSLVAAFVGVMGFVTDGDSIVAGNVSAPAPSYPARLAAYTGKSVSNTGTPFHTIADRITAYPTDVAPLYNAGTKNTLVLLCGTNDLSAGASLATLQSRVQSYASLARTTGFKIWICTILPRGDIIEPTTSAETIRLAYNSWLIANYASFADGVVDIAAIPRMQAPKDGFWYSDWLHPTGPGNALIAQEVAAATGLTVTIPVALDQVESHPNMILSNNDRTVTHTAGDGTLLAMGTTTHTTGGWYAYKVTIESLTQPAADSNTGIGFANRSHVKNTYLGVGANGVGWFGYNVYLNGWTGTVFGAYVDGDVLTIAYNPTLQKFAGKVNSGNWNNNAANDPAVGAVDVSSVPGPLYPAVEIYGGGNHVTLDLAPPGLPAGMTAWG